MKQRSLLTLLTAVLCLGIVVPTHAQSTITDMETCERFSLRCGRPDGEYSQKYCCVELNGPYPIHTCCNPYIGLAIGLCTGIPLIAALIIGVIVTYCWCTRYHNRKMDQLMIAFRRHQLEDDEFDEEDGGTTETVNPAAPPPYTPVASSENDNPEAGLPIYTESDPFAPPSAQSSESTHDSSEADSPDQPSSESQFDDVPLLSEGETAA